MMLFKRSYGYSFTAALLGLALATGVSTSVQAAIVSEGAAIIPGTSLFDFDTGLVLGLVPGADVWWEQITPTTRQLTSASAEFPALPASSLAYVGVVGVGGLSFNDLTVTDLAALTYNTIPLSGSDGSNELTPNTVFAVKTSDGNYAKVLVTFPFFQAYQNNGLGIYYVTWSAPSVVAEPETYGMLFAGLGLIGAIVRRRWV
jgi:hypothetical protein